MKRGRKVSRRLIAVEACVTAIGVCAVAIWVGYRYSESGPESLDEGSAGPVAYSTPDSGSPVAFKGESEGLKRTVVVPTLDTPIPEGRNVIWCGSFQMAWNRLKDDVVRGPIKLSKEQALADALNHDPLSESDLPAGSYYAAAGFLRDGTVEKVQEAMQEQFKKSSHLEGIPVDPSGLLAYAYLLAKVPFTIPFSEKDDFVFLDSAGHRTGVSGFWNGGWLTETQWREVDQQVQILFAIDGPKKGYHVRVKEFALDPCRTSEPNQIVLACVPRQRSLQATWEYAQRRTKSRSARRSEFRAFSNVYDTCDVFAAPNVRLSIDHHFGQLEGARLLNQGLEGSSLFTARQLLDFRLDDSGTVLESEPSLVSGRSDRPAPRDYLLDRPFLVAMRKRGGEQPFFMMWVDNAELLCRNVSAKEEFAALYRNVSAQGSVTGASSQEGSPQKEIANSIGMKLVFISAGEFMMGTSDKQEEMMERYGFAPQTFESPQHRVRITRPFYMGACHVTVGQFRQFVEDPDKTDAEKLDPMIGAFGFNQSKHRCEANKNYSWQNPGFEQADDHPVVCVSWNDAMAFCRWLSRKENKVYRLPTEAEWEYACRAGTTTLFSFGNDQKAGTEGRDVADESTLPVGTFQPNAFGLHDMHGNAAQWCWDWFDGKYYAESPTDDPIGPEFGFARVRRGGGRGWPPNLTPSASRWWGRQTLRSCWTGFRVVRAT